MKVKADCFDKDNKLMGSISGISLDNVRRKLKVLRLTLLRDAIKFLITDNNNMFIQYGIDSKTNNLVRLKK